MALIHLQLGEFGVHNVWVLLPFVLFNPHLHTFVSRPSVSSMAEGSLPF